MNTLYVNKTSDTSADTLLALGWTDMLRAVLRCLGKPHIGIVIRDIGDSFEQDLPCNLKREELQSEEYIPFLDPLISAKQDEKQAKKGRALQDGFNYDREKEKQKEFASQRMKLPPHLRVPEAAFGKDERLEALLKNGPRPELAQYMAINVMKVPDTFNEIVLRWRELTAEQQWQTIRILFDLFSQQQNDIPQARKSWEQLAKEQQIPGKAVVTAVQVINPATGKGSNVTKGNRIANGGLDSFWLLELLKFKGFMIGSAPYVLKGSKDRKTYVIVPRVVTLEQLSTIMDTFRRICWSSTAIKQDILASLRLTQTLVKQRQSEIEIGQNVDDFNDEQPLTSIASGFDVTSYKDMGSAHATMNVATVNIPTWFPRLPTLQAVNEAELILTEHIRIIRRIEGHQGKETNDEIALLQTYRDFLSGHDLRPFWLFAARYGNYLFRQREHEKDVKRWLPQLTMKGLDYLVTHHQNGQHDLRSITKLEGFQNIASAIREATVRAQRRRSQENDTTYEVRYGLDQELMRKARSRNDFLTALNQFLIAYNVETACEEEKLARRLQRRLTSADYRAHKLRYPISTKDIDQIEALLDSYPTELIASMLVAHGYARYEQLTTEEIQNDQAITAENNDSATETAEAEA